MIEIQCKQCGNKVVSSGTKMKCCGCDNLTCIRDDTITAVDLSSVVILSGPQKQKTKKPTPIHHEPKRKITKQNFEVR